MATKLRLVGEENPLQAEFELCRIIGHGWERFAPIDMERPEYGYRLSLRCIRCTSERHDIISRRTQRLSGRKYNYAEDYQWKGWEEKPSREEIKGSIFDRIRKELQATKAIGAIEQEDTADTA